MELRTIIKSEDNGIITLTINRPAALNAINSDVMNELDFLFREGIDHSSKGIVITGSGEKAIVAGADITEFNALSREEGTALSRKGHEVFNMIENYSIPVIAAVNGFSLGGGNELAMACHIRIASKHAKFGQPEVNLGLIPGYGGTQRMIQYIGKGRAMELLLTADMIDAETALNYGLVTHVTEPEELLGVAYKLIERIAGKGPLAVSKIIAAVNNYFDKKTDGFYRESEDFGTLLDSDECKEGVKAFIEKRKPNFKT